MGEDPEQGKKYLLLVRLLLPLSLSFGKAGKVFSGHLGFGVAVERKKKFWEKCSLKQPAINWEHVATFYSQHNTHSTRDSMTQFSV